MSETRDNGNGKPDRTPAEGVAYTESLPAIELSPVIWEKFTVHETPVPDAGQVWRLQWQGLVALAVIDSRREPGFVSALPLSEDPQFASDSDLILTQTESSLAMPLMVQVPLEMVVRQRVLDRCLGRLEDQAWQDLRQLRNAFVHSGSSGLPLGRVGPPVTHELDERLAYRIEQREFHSGLVFAEWYVRPSRGEDNVADLLARYLNDRKTTPKDLARVTGIAVQTLMRIVWGESPDLTESERTSLAEVLEIPLHDFAARSAEILPDELLNLLDSPRERVRIARWSETWSTDDVQTRRRMAHELIGARRRAKSMSVDEWLRLLEERFPRG